MVTIQELKQLNARIDNVKTKSATLQAEIKVLNEQLDTRLTTLSQQLGTAVTRDNLDSLYQQMQLQLDEKAKLVSNLLSDLEASPVGVTGTAPAGIPVMSQTQPAPQQMSSPVAQNMMGVNGNNIPQAQPTEQPVAASFANFGSGTTFQI